MIHVSGTAERVRTVVEEPSDGDVKATLEEQWRTRIDEISSLSVQLYTLRDPEGADADAIAGRADEQGMLERRLNAARGAAVEIEAALRRLEAGTYGLCERCSRSVGRARLEALPHARLCAPCQDVASRE